MNNRFSTQPRVYTVREWRIRQITRWALAVIGIAALIAAVITAARAIHFRPAGAPAETEAQIYENSARCAAEITADIREEAGHEYETFREGSGPWPEWYRPWEPMAAEWTAVDGLVVDPVDGATDILVGDKDVLCNAWESDEQSDTVDYNAPAIAHPPVGIDPGGIDYNLEPEVIPDYLLDVPLDRYLQEYIHRLCEESGLPFTLAVAVIEQESHYTPWIVSDTDDWGLMQINAICHEWLAAELGITDFLDPWQSVRAGIWLLADYYARYGYASGALMCYNMGEAGAKALFDQGIYSTAYSERVIGIQYRLETEGG